MWRDFAGFAKRLAQIGAIPVLLLIAPDFAYSHPAPFGITGYPVLFLHPIVVMDHAICLVAAGLLAGQQKGIALGWLLAALFVGLVAGFAVLVFTPGFPGDIFLPLLLTIVTGLVVAAAPVLKAWAIALVALSGFAIGLNTYPEGGTLFILSMTLGGLVVGAAILFLLAGWPVSLLQRKWQDVGIRIAGSWLAAIAMLILALAIKRLFAGA